MVHRIYIFEKFALTKVKCDIGTLLLRLRTRLLGRGSLFNIPLLYFSISISLYEFACIYLRNNNNNFTYVVWVLHVLQFERESVLTEKWTVFVATGFKIRRIGDFNAFFALRERYRKKYAYLRQEENNGDIFALGYKLRISLFFSIPGDTILS